jgi:hypothetical protein
MSAPLAALTAGGAPASPGEAAVGGAEMFPRMVPVREPCAAPKLAAVGIPATSLAKAGALMLL